MLESTRFRHEHTSSETRDSAKKVFKMSSTFISFTHQRYYSNQSPVARGEFVYDIMHLSMFKPLRGEAGHRRGI